MTCFLASSSERKRDVGRISEKYRSLADLSGCCACSSKAEVTVRLLQEVQKVAKNQLHL